jgi:hypothetical protein
MAADLDETTLARKIIDISQTVAAGYHAAGSVDGVQAAHNTGVFILQGLGYPADAVHRLLSEWHGR